MRLAGHRRIAVFRAIFLGDLLLAVPAFRALRAGFPDAEITLIGLPWAAAFVERFGRYVDRFVEFAGYPGIMEVPVDPARTERFLAEQRAYGYDLVIQMHGSGGASNPFVLALGGKVTAGYYLGTPPAGMALAAPYPDDQPELLRNLGLARLVGCATLDPTLEFPLSEEDRAEAAAHLSRLPPAHRPLVGLHPGAKAPARRWPPEYFAALADDLARRYDAHLILTGSPAETPIVRAVDERMRAPRHWAGWRPSSSGWTCSSATIPVRRIWPTPSTRRASRSSAWPIIAAGRRSTANATPACSGRRSAARNAAWTALSTIAACGASDPAWCSKWLSGCWPRRAGKRPRP